MYRPRLASTALAGADVVGGVAAATGAVALLERVAPVEGLGVVYLLAVFFVAFRRGEVAALATAVLAVLALNYFFIEPRHRLTIADSRNVAALAVFLIAAVLVGRLASAARQRARESEVRARVAAAREREAALLAQVASWLLEGHAAAQLTEPGGRLGAAVAAHDLRFELAPVPSPREGEVARPLRLHDRSAWLYATRGSGWDEEGLERVAEPLARLVDVALERERLGEEAARVDAARRADAAKTAVLQAISHDLRSPLTAITTATSALRSGPLSADDQAELLAVVGAESTRLARLFDDLLDLSRIEAGAVDPQPDWCDLRDTVSSAAEQVRRQRPGAIIELRFDPDLPLVRADAVQMERVFSNLIDNAVKFSPAGEPVVVTATSAARRVTVRVDDHGRGVSPQTRAHVFEPFFRGRGPAAGSGLGLTICRGFAEANGADLRLLAARGKGSSFAVSFPLEAQPSAPA
jgi:two-component system sensor histidine kinase KdpD